MLELEGFGRKLCNFGRKVFRLRRKFGNFGKKLYYFYVKFTLKLCKFVRNINVAENCVFLVRNYTSWVKV